MKVVLLKEVKGLGRKGEVKDVAEGFAQNFLVPKRLAEITTKHGLKVKEDMERKKQRVEKKIIGNRQVLANKINGKTFTVFAKTDDKGTLYEKIKIGDIINVVKSGGFELLEKDINLTENIKHLGLYSINLNLAGKKATISLAVEKII